MELTFTQSHLPGEKAAQFAAAVAIHSVSIFIPPGTHYCWVDRGSVDFELAQGFHTWLALQESNPRPLDLRSNALTSWQRAPSCKKIYSWICQIAPVLANLPAILCDLCINVAFWYNYNYPRCALEFGGVGLNLFYSKEKDWVWHKTWHYPLQNLRWE